MYIQGLTARKKSYTLLGAGRGVVLSSVAAVGYKVRPPFLLFYSPHWLLSLEFIDLVLRIPELLQDTREVALVSRADLRATEGLIHAGRATDKDLDILALWVWQEGLEQLLRDESLSVLPVAGRRVQGIVGAEPLRELLLDFLELFLQ